MEGPGREGEPLLSRKAPADGGLDRDIVSMRRYAMTREELQATARLARLPLGDDEADAALPAFERMLEHFAAMAAADGDEAAFGAPIRDLGTGTSGLRLPGAMRHDRPANSNQNNARHNPNPLNNLASELMNRAPESENGFFVLPNVL